MNSRFKLLLCELHYEKFHGKTEDSYQNIDGHYLLIEIFKPPSTDENYIRNDNDFEENKNYSNYVQTLYKFKYNLLIKRGFFIKNPHNIIKNFHNIVANKNYFNFEIGECIILPTNETIVIKKTFWIKIIQRTWKKIFKKRKCLMLSNQFLKNRQLGIINMSQLPSIKGLMRK